MAARYGFGKTVNLSFDAALERVTQELQKEGFGVVTEIDVQATLKKKLNADVLIEPNLPQHRNMSQQTVKSLIDAGERAALDALPAMRKLFSA